MKSSNEQLWESRVALIASVMSDKYTSLLFSALEFGKDHQYSCAIFIKSNYIGGMC